MQICPLCNSYNTNYSRSLSDFAEGQNMKVVCVFLCRLNGLQVQNKGFFISLHAAHRTLGASEIRSADSALAEMIIIIAVLYNTRNQY